MTVFNVLPDDYGIRPAGPRDACFYCQSKVGTPHASECVVIVRDVTYSVQFNGEEVATYKTTDPSDWESETLYFHKNNSSWCASNIEKDNGLTVINLEKWGELDHSDETCLCDQVELIPVTVGEEIKRAK